MLHIKANEELFNRWRDLAREINCLAAMAQNDVTVSETDFDDWVLDAYMMRDKLIVLIKRTEAHCQQFASEVVYRRDRKETK